MEFDPVPEGLKLGPVATVLLMAVVIIGVGVLGALAFLWMLGAH